jgi:para-nitrobenzyl esterase
VSVVPEVETQYGRVRGSEEAGIRVFRGLRFAQPPSDEQRFLPPAPPEPWTGTYDATESGPAAPQMALPWFGWISAAAVAPGEDCLSLNVWTPALDGRRRPVLVWMHGGGFLVGAGSTGVYDGAALARRGDVVVVTVNYRLGAMGYAHLGLLFEDESFEGCTNLGVRDQIAALEWVRDNIDRFGGDPGSVTVFGQSAGAMSVAALLGAPRARALFHRAICMSGAAGHIREADEARATAEAFVDRLGQPRPSSHKGLGWFPMDRLLRAQHDTMMDLMNLSQMMVFLPVVDGDVIPEQPLDAIRRGDTAHIPLLVGTTLDEWQLFRLFEEGPFAMKEEDLLSRFDEALDKNFSGAPDAESAVREFRGALESRGARARNGDVWIEFQSTREMHYPATRLAEAQNEGGGTAHNYLFTWRPPTMRRAIGACHALDIPFVFGSVQHPLARPLTGFTTSATRLSQKIQQAWIQFAREGNPSHERLPRWEAYETGERHTMVLGRRCGMDHAPLEGERSLIARWKGHDTPRPKPMPQSVTKPQRHTPSILERASAAVFSRA